MAGGVLLYAHNNEVVDYAKLAACAAILVKLNMPDTPIALITDEESVVSLRRMRANVVEKLFDHLILVKRGSDENYRPYPYGNETVTAVYRNVDRPTAYELSPFDETILLDSDLLVLDGTLNHVWNTGRDLLMNRKAIFAGTWAEANRFKRIDPLSIPMYWATQVFFRKGKLAQQFFELIRHVKTHYTYYAKLYRFDASQYRNDFTFSVAAHILNGEIEGSDCVGSFGVPHILTVYEPGGLVHVIDHQKMIFATKVSDAESLVPVRIENNIHCMSKQSLLLHAKQIIHLLYS